MNHDISQDTGIKIIPVKKKCKKVKWLTGEALQIAVKRREAKSKGEKERYKHLNAEFQRIARRDKKAFFSDQCKEKEEKNRMGKTRDTKGIFHEKMVLIRTEMVQTQQKQMILRRGCKNAPKNCTKKIFMTRIIMMM